MNLLPALGTSLGIALFGGIITPALNRYRAWRDGPRAQVARRDWRGRYVPDLGVKRIERSIKFGMIALFILGCVELWAIMYPAGK